MKLNVLNDDELVVVLMVLLILGAATAGRIMLAIFEILIPRLRELERAL